MKNDKVLLVSKEFDYGKDGIGVVSRETYNKLVEIRPSTKKLSLKDYAGKFRNPILQGVGKVFEGRALAEVMRIKPDIIHAMAPDHASLLNADIKTKIVTWHDMILLGRTKEKGLLGYKYKTKMRLWKKAHENADIIIDVSKETGRHREKYFGKKPSYVVNNGISDAFLRTDIWNGKRDGFVYVGAIEYASKNINSLVKFIHKYNSVYDEKQKLNIFTATRNPQAVIESIARVEGLKNVDDIISVIGNASDIEIAERIRKSVALVNLALEEGFGITILSAQACGTPSIVLRGADIPEVVSRNAIKCSMEELGEKAHGLYIRQSPLENRKIKYARSFTWKRAAEKINSIYDKA